LAKRHILDSTETNSALVIMFEPPCLTYLIVKNKPTTLKGWWDFEKAGQVFLRSIPRNGYNPLN